jgi:hypothetical protein
MPGGTRKGGRDPPGRPGPAGAAGTRRRGGQKGAMMARLLRGIAVPCFADDPAELIDLGIEAVPGDVAGLAGAYQAAGATWWIETAKPEPLWWPGVQQRVAAGV